MPPVASPRSSRTTCLYDAPARHVAVATPSGARCTFAFDAANQRPAMLEVSTSCVTWTADPSLPTKDKCECRPTNGEATFQYDSSSIRRLTNRTGCRTTFAYHAPPAGDDNRIVPDQTIFVIEPTGAESIVLIFRPVSRDKTLYLGLLNVRRFQAANDWNAAWREFGRVLELDETRRILKRVAHGILKGARDQATLDDLQQEGYLRLLECQAAGGLSLKDYGPDSFIAWIKTVCSRAAYKYLKRERGPKDVPTERLRSAGSATSRHDTTDRQAPAGDQLSGRGVCRSWYADASQ